VHSQGKQTNIELHPRLLVATSLKKMLQIMQLVYNNRAQQSSHSNIIKLIYCKQESFPRQLSKGFDLVIVARKSNRRLRCSVADLGQNFIGLISERVCIEINVFAAKCYNICAAFKRDTCSIGGRSRGMITWRFIIWSIAD
jgi:hypothetical protein